LVDKCDFLPSLGLSSWLPPLLANLSIFSTAAAALPLLLGDSSTLHSRWLLLVT